MCCAALSVVLAQGAGINTGGLRQFLTDNDVTVVIVIIGLALLVYALRGEASRVLTVVALSVVGLAFLALGTITALALGTITARMNGKHPSASGGK